MSDEKKNELKLSLPADCKAGKHQFMVTRWRDRGGHRTAVHLRCSRCLMLVDNDRMNSINYRELLEFQ